MSMREQKAKEYLNVIGMLAAFGPVRSAYVAREMKLTRPTVCVAVRKLAEDGLITVDREHLLHLTEAGKRLTRAAAEPAGSGDPEAGERALAQDVDSEQIIRRLEKGRSAAFPEAVLILSGRYYAVRVVDVAQYLGCSSATARAKLRRLAGGGYLALGEEGSVCLTPAGRRIAEELYARRAPGRDRLMKQGYSILEAEREALRAETGSSEKISRNN